MKCFGGMLVLVAIIFMSVTEITASHMILDGIQLNHRSKRAYGCDSQGYFDQIAAEKEAACNVRLATETAALTTFKTQCLSTMQGVITTEEAKLTNCSMLRSALATSCDQQLQSLASQLTTCMSKCPVAPTGLTLRTLSTGSYYISSSTETKNWFMADAFCKSNGLELASVETEAESNALIAAFGAGTDRFWISGTDSGSEGRFYWSGVGKVLEHFWFFENGQPDNAGGNENCVQYFVHPFITGATYKWNDDNCNTPYRFVCELESTK